MRSSAGGAAAAVLTAALLLVGRPESGAGAERPTPLGLPPAGSPASAAEVALGRKLFGDPRLSGDGTLACATCHIPAQAFADNRSPTAVGAAGRPLRRNAPTLLNVAYATALFHDGRAPSLEAQALGPLLSRDEMANASAEDLVSRIETLPDYRAPFERAYRGGPSVERIARALAAYQRTLLSGGSPFDRWYFGGEADALSEAAERGFRLFVGRAGCVACHKLGEGHALFADGEFHFIGTGLRTAGGGAAAFADGAGPLRPLDLGRREATGDPADQWRYRTPSLRNVALTAPYMHDGSFATLEDVVRYYNYTGIWHPRLDARIRPLGLLEDEIAALVAFLESLTGDNVADLAREAEAAN